MPTTTDFEVAFDIYCVDTGKTVRVSTPQAIELWGKVEFIEMLGGHDPRFVVTHGYLAIA